MLCLSARKSKKDVIDKESVDILSTFVLLCRPQDPEFSSPAASLSGASVGAVFIIRWESAREKERPIYFHFGKRIIRGRKGRKKQERM